MAKLIELSTPINRTSVILYPELIASSLKKKEGELYVVWSVLKTSDSIAYGSGRIGIVNILYFIRLICGLEQSRAYDLFKKGIGKYWNKPGKDASGEKVTTLVGRQNLIKYLQPTSTRSEPFVFKQDRLEFENTTELKNLLIAMIASRYVDMRPVSIQSISDITGQSVSTVKRAIKNCPDINSYVNICTLSVHSTISEAKAAFNVIFRDKPGAYKIREQNGFYTVCRQLPNMYTLCDTSERLPLRKRPRELKERDRENLSNLQEKRYYKKQSKKPVASEHLTLNGVESSENGMYFSWKLQGNKQVKEMSSRAKIWKKACEAYIKFRKKNNV